VLSAASHAQDWHEGIHLGIYLIWCVLIIFVPIAKHIVVIDSPRVQLVSLGLSLKSIAVVT
jgi:hypothetical protein